MAQGIEAVLPHVNFGTDPLPDLYTHIDGLRRAGRQVAPVNYIDGIAWLLIDYDDVEAAYSNEKDIPAAPAYFRHSVPSQGLTLLAMEGERHRINRALVSRPFQPGAIRALVEPMLAPVANRLIDGFGTARELDLVERYTHPYPFTVISELVGIPAPDRAHFMRTILLLFRYPWEPERALQARREVTDYLVPLIQERRAHPAQDVISLLAAAEVEGHLLTDEEICSFVRLLYPAGAETTFLTMGSMLVEILSDRSLYDRLLRDPTLRSAAVEESLRKHGAVTLQPRYTEREIEIAGITIPADSWILFGNGPAAHDDAVFPDPERFQLDRGSNRHLAFGKGPHFCLGSHLAREELRLSLDLLLDRLPGLRLTGEAQIAGSVLRGVHSLPVAFEDLLPTSEHA